MPMPIESKQLIGKVKAGEDLLPAFKMLSENEANEFFLRDIALQRSTYFWDKISVTFWPAFFPFFAGLLYHEYCREKLPAPKDIRRDDPSYHTAESVTGFIALGAFTECKEAFENLWNKASSDTRSKVLTSVACTNSFDSIGFPTHNGLYGLFLFGQFNALDFIAKSTSPWTISKAYGNSTLEDTIERNTFLSVTQKRHITQLYENIATFIKHPKRSIKNNPKEFTDFIIKHCEPIIEHLNSLPLKQLQEELKSNKEYKKWFKLLSKAISAIPPENKEIKDRLLLLQGHMAYAKKDYVKTYQIWEKLDKLPPHEALIVSDFLSSHHYQMQPMLTQVQCEIRSMIMGHHAKVSLNIKRDDVRYQKQLERSIDLLIDDLGRMMPDTRPSFWKKNNVSRKSIVSLLKELKSNKSDDHLMQAENVLKVLIKTSENKLYLSLLKDTQKTLYEFRSIRMKNSPQEHIRHVR